MLGLGLGLLAETLKVEKECSVVDVVDNNQELIDYVNYIDDSITIEKADAFTYKPSKKYDLILVDLWWGPEDITQEINQDIVQDVFYEMELIQDIVQEVEINQTYTVEEVRTETRTRLVGE